MAVTATINGAETTQPVGTLGDIQLGPPAKVLVEILPEKDGQPAAFTIHPGETITARVRVQRKDFAGRIEFGTDDCGRNLPHGVYVDNIGLNGLLIVEGQSERTFTITASPVAAEGLRPFHLRTTADGTQASSAVILRVVK